MHVERMAAMATRTLEDYPHGFSPVLVGDDHKVSLLWGRGSPRRVLLNGVQSGIRGIADVINPTIHEGVNLEPIDDRE